MPKKQSFRDLSIDELRWLLMEKRRASRQQRLEHYRRTGRIMTVTPDAQHSPLSGWHMGTLLEEETTPAPRSRGKRVLDGFLLIVEVSAVLGFVFILYSGLNIMRELNQEVVTLLEQPTLTPTPLISAVVLPSGHTPPNSPGGAQFNEAEIPEHLRPLVQSLVNVAPPTPSPEQASRIQIPALNVDAPVVLGDGWEQLKKGVGQNLTSTQPGENGNLILSAHNDIFGEIFRDLDRLKAGDPVIIYTQRRAYTYIVSDSQLVEPNDTEVMEQTDDATVTLISCYPYMIDNQRIVVTARLQKGGN